jgi:hypothetical protein
MVVRSRWWLRRVAATTATALVVISLSTAPAQAATTLGLLSIPNLNCDAVATYVQTVPPAGSTYATSAGVITSWTYQATNGFNPPPQVKLKVLRATSPTSYYVVGETAVIAPTLGQLATYPAQIAVQQGDLLGLTVLTSSRCADASSGAQYRIFPGDALPGGTLSSVDPNAINDFFVPLGARLEADVDKDGYGDETQDACPGEASTHGTCPDRVAPNTSLGSGPGKTAKHKAKFTFSSDEPGTFECRLTGAKVTKPALEEFRPCSSPQVYKGLAVGKYKFAVRALDQAGNVDSSPVEQKLKVIARQ